MSRAGPRVAGVDPGTVSFDVCALDGGEVVLERSFRTVDVGADPAPLVEALSDHGPFELVLGPAGYGLPLVPAEQVGERELALMLLVREDEPRGRVGVGGMRSIVRALIAAGLPLVFGPGAIHLPTIPAYRKWNRIDLGTADKVASVALCIADQARRLGIGFAETSFVMLELGGGLQRRPRRRRRAHRRRARRFRRADRSAGVRCARRRGRVPPRRRPVEANRVQRRRARSAGRARSLTGAGGAAARPAPPRGMACARGGRGQGRARADGQRAGPARDPRRGAHGAGAGRAGGARRATCGRGAGADGGGPRARTRRPPPRARPCWPTASRAGATRRSSSASAWPRRAALRSITSGCTAPTGSGCADQAAASSHSRTVV